MFKGMIKVLGAYTILASMIATQIITYVVHDNVSVNTVSPTPIVVEEIAEVPMRTYNSSPISRIVVMNADDIETDTVVTVEEKIEAVAEPEVIEAVKEELPLTQEEIELIALLTMGEAEGESEEGKRLVIDTVLNRVDSELSYFPDTVKEVIYQSNQFSCMWDGRIENCYVSEDICQLVKEELKSRTNDDVLWFRADYYGKYGTPLLVEGNHYFSSI